MYKSKYNMADIINWHKETFPKATLEGQRKKFDEEHEEFKKAVKLYDQDAVLEELADMYIVSLGEARFDSSVGMLSLAIVTKLISDPFIALAESGEEKEEDTAEWAKDMFIDVMKKVDEKMEVNIKRKWTYKDGQYKHVKEDKEEKKEAEVHVVKCDSLDDVIAEIRKIMESTLKDAKDVQDS